LYYSPSVYGYKWLEMGGHWTVFVVRYWDVYNKVLDKMKGGA
jgi:hypothetical protein